MKFSLVDCTRVTRTHGQAVAELLGGQWEVTGTPEVCEYSGGGDGTLEDEWDFFFERQGGLVKISPMEAEEVRRKLGFLWRGVSLTRQEVSHATWISEWRSVADAL